MVYKYQYEKMSEGIKEGRLFRNERSKFQPSYNLVMDGNKVMNITGFSARQIEEYEPKLLNKNVEIDIVKKFSKKYMRDYFVVNQIVLKDNSFLTIKNEE
jgi:hypothetical protein